ncbi:MAG: winged helix-turn-helix domain-containing protein [Chitinophagaceae bacterium]|jgi:Holliday junction resolvase|nr:winged helix-turn-helix domain-containing protein [Chitinophagaceae bacterium]
MNKFKTAAILILTEASKPLHYKEITKLALDKGILETEGATPEASMNSQIITDINKKGEASDFIKTAPSTFALNTNKKVLEPKKQKKVLEEEAAEEEKISLETGFTGKAGEHLVCSELLFRGYNASIMSVDSGMDIIATKNNKLFSIQVKTANANAFDTYNFDVRKISFEKDYAGNTFYVFILKGKQQTHFLIIPLHEMEKKVAEKAIIYIQSYKKYRVKIDIREDKIYLGNRNHEMKYYLNNWDVIK